MAFGIDRQELSRWKEAVERGEIAYLTHFWLDPRSRRDVGHQGRLLRSGSSGAMVSRQRA